VVRGRRIRTSTEIEGNAKGLGKREANEWLKQRQSDAAQGISTPRADKITVADLVAELWRQYDIDLRKTKPEDQGRWRLHLEPFFGSMKALDVTRGVIREYIALRLSQPDHRGSLPKNATINRELSVLREAYSLALKDERLRHAPSFRGLLLAGVS
jgi:hypothetical protein